MTQVDAAKAQLDRALILFLQDRDYIPAATLAGAAEGILGGMLSDRHKERRVMGIEDDSPPNSFQEHRELYAWLSGATADDAGMGMRAPRNALNHATTGKSFDFNPAAVAEEIIGRAMSDYHRLTGEFHERYSDFCDATEGRACGDSR